MNSLVERGILEEMECGTNFAYLLNNNNDFLPLEYKVMQSQNTDCFVKCVKMLYNGKVQLFYMLRESKPLSAVLPSLSPEGFVTVVTNLLRNIIAVKSIGFMACNNIDISFERIYVVPNTLNVGLVYLPIDTHLYFDYASFESELRSKLIGAINRYPQISSNKAIQLAENLSNVMLTLEDILTALRGGRISSDTPRSKEGNKTLRLVSMSAANPLELVMDKDHYTIGRKAAEVDGLITFSRAVSKTHCRIDKMGDGFTITDVGSTHGTFVNGEMIKPERPVAIRDNDVVKLANVKLQVVIR